MTEEQSNIVVGKTKLGDKAKDPITGFTGIVIARTEHLYGCVQCGVKSKELKDGMPINAQWFDEPSLVVLVDLEVEPAGQTTGGPKENPPLS